MARQKLKRHEMNVKSEKKNMSNTSSKTNDSIQKNQDIQKLVEKNKTSTIAENIINTLENKHIPIASRFYKIFWVLKKNNDKKLLKKHLIIFFGGIFISLIFFILGILFITGVIPLDFLANANSIFAGSFWAIAVIMWIVI